MEEARQHPAWERKQVEGGTDPQVILHHRGDSGMDTFTHVPQGREANYATDEWTIVAVIGFDGEVRVKGDGGSTVWRPRAEETSQNGFRVAGSPSMPETGV